MHSSLRIMLPISLTQNPLKSQLKSIKKQTNVCSTLRFSALNHFSIKTTPFEFATSLSLSPSPPLYILATTYIGSLRVFRYSCTLIRNTRKPTTYNKPAAVLIWKWSRDVIICLDSTPTGGNILYIHHIPGEMLCFIILVYLHQHLTILNDYLESIHGIKCPAEVSSDWNALVFATR